MFSIDTETGFPDMVVIDAAWGLGENVVQGGGGPRTSIRSSNLSLASRITWPIVEEKVR